MTKGELLSALAAMPNDAEIVLYVREWGSTLGGEETYIGKYLDVFDIDSGVNEFGEMSVFLIGDDD